jgi:hypothetical protein
LRFSGLAMATVATAPSIEMASLRVGEGSVSNMRRLGLEDGLKKDYL